MSTCVRSCLPICCTFIRHTTGILRWNTFQKCRTTPAIKIETQTRETRNPTPKATPNKRWEKNEQTIKQKGTNHKSTKKFPKSRRIISVYYSNSCGVREREGSLAAGAAAHGCASFALQRVDAPLNCGIRLACNKLV